MKPTRFPSSSINISNNINITRENEEPSFTRVTYKRNKRARSLSPPNKLAISTKPTSPIVLIQPPTKFPKDSMDFQPDILEKLNNLVLPGTPGYY